jgi:hypothetical protein
MRIWRFADPGDYRFAQASRRGSWSPSAGPCPECGASSQKRIQPLILEWEPGADVVGDFTWSGFGSDIAVTERVAEDLRSFGGFQPGPIEMIQSLELSASDGVRPTRPRVSLPYQGPQLYELWVTQNVHLDLEKSSVRLIKACGTCGHRQYEVDGIERRELTWDAERGESVRAHIPRSQGKGLFVAAHVLAETAIFRTLEFPTWVLCTDRVKELVTQNGFTNVTFLEIGDRY